METKIPELSERLARLPVCPRRKLPLPYANLITHEGTPDFAVLDSTNVHASRGIGYAGCAGFHSAT